MLTLCSGNASTCIEFVTGKGYRHSRKDTTQSYSTITLVEILAQLKNPTDSAKESASWILLSSFKEHNAREASAQIAYGVFHGLVADIDSGNFPREQITEAVKDLLGPARGMIYSTGSATAESRRWRVIIWLKDSIPGAEWVAAQRLFFQLLEKRYNIKADGAMANPSQIMLLPNVPKELRDENGAPYFYEAEEFLGELFCYEGSEIQRILREDEETEPNALQAVAVQVQKRKQDFFRPSLIEKFNERNPLRALFRLYQYSQKGNSVHWRSPYQKSGSFATRDYGDFWVSLSGSDADQEIGRGKGGYRFGDAFDLYVHYEFSGAFQKALRAITKEYEEPIEFGPLQIETSGAQKKFDGSQLLSPESLPEEILEPKSVAQSIPAANSLTERLERETIHFANLELVLDNLFLIKNFLLQGQISVIYGPPNVGKSFLALDLAFAVSSLSHWNGHPVSGGPVLYIAGEGGKLFHNRLWALQEEMGIQNESLYIYPHAVSFLPNLTEVNEKILPLFQGIVEKHGQGPKLLVIDTLSCAIPGADENSPDAMTRFIAGLKEIRDKTNVHICVIHHCGKNKNAGARGHSSLTGAVDTEFEVALASDPDDPDRRIAIQTKKQRDLPTQPPVFFQIEPVVLGKDKEGDAVTSCVIEYLAPESQDLTCVVPRPSAREVSVRKKKTLSPGGDPDLQSKIFRFVRKRGLRKGELFTEGSLRKECSEIEKIGTSYAVRCATEELIREGHLRILQNPKEYGFPARQFLITKDLWISVSGERRCISPSEDWGYTPDQEAQYVSWVREEFAERRRLAESMTL